MRIADVELGEIARQVSGRDVVVDPCHASLEDRELVLGRVAVIEADADVLARRVVENGVRSEFLPDLRGRPWRSPSSDAMRHSAQHVPEGLRSDIGDME
jgi:hypothetical protein